MPIEDLPPDVQSLIGSSKPEDLQRLEQVYKDRYGTREIDSIPDPRADTKPSVKPEGGAPSGSPQETEDFYKKTYGYGDPDDSGAPQQQGEIPADHIPTVREAFGDQYQTDYAVCAKYVQDRFSDNREQFSRLEQAVVAEIGEVEALKLLRKLAKK